MLSTILNSDFILELISIDLHFWRSRIRLIYLKDLILRVMILITATSHYHEQATDGSSIEKGRTTTNDTDTGWNTNNIVEAISNAHVQQRQVYRIPITEGCSH